MGVGEWQEAVVQPKGVKTLETIEVGDLVAQVYTKAMYVVIGTRWSANVLICTVVSVKTCKETIIASHKLIKINKNT